MILSPGRSFALRPTIEEKVERRLAATLSAGMEEPPPLVALTDTKPFPPPVQTNRAWFGNFELLSYLNRHRAQWRWIRTNVLPEIAARKEKEGRRTIRVFVGGASTGEELARAFHETAAWLQETGRQVASDPNDAEKWQIEVVGLEQHFDVATEGQARLNGDSPFVWKDEERAALSAEQLRDYSVQVVQTLNRYLPASRRNLRIAPGNLVNLVQQRIAGRTDEAQADLVILNMTLLYIQGAHPDILKEVDTAWPEAWIASTYEMKELTDPDLRHAYQRVRAGAPATTYYFGRPLSAKSAGLEESWDQDPESQRILNQYPNRVEVFYGRTDPENGRIHVERVLRIAQLLAESEPDFPPQEARLLKIVTALHDAGRFRRSGVAAMQAILRLRMEKGIFVPFRVRDLADFLGLDWDSRHLLIPRTIALLADRLIAAGESPTAVIREALVSRSIPVPPDFNAEETLKSMLADDEEALAILNQLVLTGEIPFASAADRQVVEAVLRASVWAGLLTTQPAYTNTLLPGVAARAERLSELLELADVTEASMNLSRTEAFYGGMDLAPRDVANLIRSVHRKVAEGAISVASMQKVIGLLNRSHPGHPRFIQVISQSRRIELPNQNWSTRDLDLIERISAGVNFETILRLAQPVQEPDGYVSDNWARSRLVRELTLSGQWTVEQAFSEIVEPFRPSRRLPVPSGLIVPNTPFVVSRPSVSGLPDYRQQLAELSEELILRATDDPARRALTRALVSIFLERFNGSLFADEPSPISALSGHEADQVLYELIRVGTGNPDPLRELKEQENNVAFQLLASAETAIQASPDPLLASIQVGIVGNAQDFATAASRANVGQIAQLEAPIRQAIQQGIGWFTNPAYQQLRDRLSAGPQTILLITDNAGEVVLDLPFIARLLANRHTVILAGRGPAPINDMTADDLRVLLERPEVTDYLQNIPDWRKRLRVISNGSDVTGVDLRRVPVEFIDAWLTADIRIAKGQGNRETLGAVALTRDLFHLLKVKENTQLPEKLPPGSNLILYKPTSSAGLEESPEPPQRPDRFGKDNYRVARIGGSIAHTLRPEDPVFPDVTYERPPPHHGKLPFRKIKPGRSIKLRQIQRYSVPLRYVGCFAVGPLTFRIVPMGADQIIQPPKEESGGVAVEVAPMAKRYLLQVWLNGDWVPLDMVHLEDGVPVTIGREDLPRQIIDPNIQQDLEGVIGIPVDDARYQTVFAGWHMKTIADPEWRIAVSWTENELQKTAYLPRQALSNAVSRGDARVEPRPGWHVANRKFIPKYTQTGHLQIEIMGDEVTFSDLGSSNPTEIEIDRVWAASQGHQIHLSHISLAPDLWDESGESYRASLDDSDAVESAPQEGQEIGSSQAERMVSDLTNRLKNRLIVVEHLTREPVPVNPDRMVQFPFERPFELSFRIQNKQQVTMQFIVQEGQLHVRKSDTDSWRPVGHSYRVEEAIPVPGQEGRVDVPSRVEEGYQVLYAPGTNTVLVLNHSPYQIQVASLSAGLEAPVGLDPELFIRRHPAQAVRLPSSVNAVVVIPSSMPLTFYRPETLAESLNTLIRQQEEVLGAMPIDQLPVPTSRDDVKVPSAIVWDRWLGNLPYASPVPVITTALGEPFPYSLPQMVAIALYGQESAASRVLSAWTFDVEGRHYLAIALSA
ncbi:MAG: ARMT1-like domain-containing protein [Candidatus Omnitrophica bacterium]|nr:ARMT1-like domain-containing protein [Candidatus Omnitrophota bacterium]